MKTVPPNLGVRLGTERSDFFLQSNDCSKPCPTAVFLSLTNCSGHIHATRWPDMSAFTIPELHQPQDSIFPVQTLDEPIIAPKPRLWLERPVLESDVRRKRSLARPRTRMPKTYKLRPTANAHLLDNIASDVATLSPEPVVKVDEIWQPCAFQYNHDEGLLLPPDILPPLAIVSLATALPHILENARGREPRPYPVVCCTKVQFKYS